MLKKIAISTLFVVGMTFAGVGSVAAKAGSAKVGGSAVVSPIVPQGLGCGGRC
jgi:hypothetical protein